MYQKISCRSPEAIVFADYSGGQAQVRIAKIVRERFLGKPIGASFYVDTQKLLLKLVLAEHSEGDLMVGKLAGVVSARSLKSFLESHDIRFPSVGVKDDDIKVTGKDPLELTAIIQMEWDQEKKSND